MSKLNVSEMTENIKALNHCIGYGNPSAKYWFISLEEGGGYCEKNEEGEIDSLCEERELKRLEIYKNKFSNNNFIPYSLSNEELSEFYLKFPSEKEKVIKDISYKNYCSIFNHFNATKISSDNIGDSNINLFISNLYPLSRKTVKSEYDKFAKDFIFNGDFKEWKNLYWKDRKKNIGRFFTKNFDPARPTTILCFGADSDNGFNEVLSDICNQEIKLSFEKKFVLNNLNIFHTYHPGRINTNNKTFDVEYVIKLLSD